MNIGKKTVFEFADDIDKKSNGMNITVADSEEESKEILNEESKEKLNEESIDILSLKVVSVSLEERAIIYYSIVFY